MQIREDDLTGSEVVSLLREHLEEMHENTPPESVHALGLEELRAPEITFWSVWDHGELLGCGALKALSSRSGEIKSMRTAIPHRGRGVASKVLERIIREAQRRSYDCLCLETGSGPEFTGARTLYAGNGFGYRGPFGAYVDDPNSVFMTKALS